MQYYCHYYYFCYHYDIIIAALKPSWLLTEPQNFELLYRDLEQFLVLLQASIKAFPNTPPLHRRQDLKKIRVISSMDMKYVFIAGTRTGISQLLSRSRIQHGRWYIHHCLYSVALVYFQGPSGTPLSTMRVVQLEMWRTFTLYLEVLKAITSVYL